MTSLAALSPLGFVVFSKRHPMSRHMSQLWSSQTMGNSSGQAGSSYAMNLTKIYRYTKVQLHWASSQREQSHAFSSLAAAHE